MPSLFSRCNGSNRPHYTPKGGPCIVCHASFSVGGVSQVYREVSNHRDLRCSSDRRVHSSISVDREVFVEELALGHDRRCINRPSITEEIQRLDELGWPLKSLLWHDRAKLYRSNLSLARGGYGRQCRILLAKFGPQVSEANFQITLPLLTRLQDRRRRWKGCSSI